MIEALFSFIAVAAWAGHTADSRGFAEDIEAALVKCCGSQKAAAYFMGLGNEQQLSRQLAGVEPLNVYRLCSVPGFWLAFLKIHALRLGGEFLSPDDKAFVLGFVGMGKAKLARFFPSLCHTDVPSSQPERRVQ